MASGWRERALDRLAAARPWAVWSFAAIAVVLVSVADWFSGAEVAASLLYLLPICVVAWNRGRIAAMAVAWVCAVTWLVIDHCSHWDNVFTGLELVNGAVLLAGLAFVGQLIATLRVRLQREQRLAHTDALTGLNNRRAFWNAALREVQRSQRFGEPFSLAYIDVDRFKGVNDRYGHAAGDDLLRRIALELQVDMRDLDMVARLGGDEFAVLLPGTNAFGANTVLSRLRTRLDQAPWRSAFDIDFSVGCLTLLTPPADVDAVIRRADQLMYETKRTSRGQMRHEVITAAPAEVAAMATSTMGPAVGPAMATSERPTG
jgi:diguanylate cyclase (GGDEF)-like protein